MSLGIGAGTNYDQTKGNAASNFSFQGVDPGPYVEAVTSSAAGQAESDIRLAHYQCLNSAFALELPNPVESAGLETSVIISRYNYTAAGDPYLESLLFAHSSHLFISSSRENSLPPNPQGRWTSQLEPA
jgi:alpha-L-fucosidase 2